MSAAAPLVNGFTPTPAPNISINEALEYEKILKLRDERNFSPRPPVQLTLQNHLAIPAPFPPSTSPSQQQTQPARRDLQPSPTSVPPTGATVSLSQPTAGTISEFDPVLLTKPDVLLRAETQLKRQRLEKALKDQFEQKRLDARKRPAPAEAKPDFEIPALLAKAIEATKTVVKDDASASDSFDENSFYSSRAPDSTPERGRPSQSPQPNEADDEYAADHAPGKRVQSAVMGEPLNVDADDDYSPRPAHRDNSPAYSPPLDLDDDEEEGEYSPPEATEHDSAVPDVGSSAAHDVHDPRNRPLRRYSEIDDGIRRPGQPPDANMRIVRNHITSPIAPQPSRVSPLAVAKDPPLQQVNRHRKHRDQPPSPDQGYPHPKKRRRVDRKERKGRRNGMSPDAMVKDENVSPPPFHEIQPLGAGRPRASNQDQPILIDDAPPAPRQGTRYVAVDDRYPESPRRPTSRLMEAPLPMSEPRVASRASMRPMRDTQDLRRVASMHNVRAEVPDDYATATYNSPARPRVASYREGSPMVLERQRVDNDYQPPPELRVSRTPAPIYREVYQDEPRVRYEPMPPAREERIVEDQYGRRYREIIEPPAAPPRAVSVRPRDIEPASYDQYRGGRSGSVFVDAQQDRRYAQGMPPPPTIYRQAPDNTRSSVAAPAREFYDQPPTVRGSSVFVDRPSHQPVYEDDRGEFREPMRVGSVRPVGHQYEGTIGRSQSVRPGARDGTVVIDERGLARREYLPVEQPRYRVVEPGERYVDVQGREVLPPQTLQRY